MYNLLDDLSEHRLAPRLVRGTRIAPKPSNPFDAGGLVLEDAKGVFGCRCGRAQTREREERREWGRARAPCALRPQTTARARPEA